MSDSHMKDVNLEELKLLIKLLSLFAGSPEERFKLQELHELEIAKRFLTCPYFEKRIKGMKEFKLIQEKVLNRATRPPNDNNRPVRYEVAKHLDMASFSAWIIKNKVIDFIFEENPHQELIKRSYSILSLMAQDAQTFPEEMVTLIWSCCSPEKHEDIVRATYELITELAMCLPAERLEGLFKRVRSIGLQSIDDKAVLFLRDYTINTIENLKQVKRREAQKQTSGRHGASGGSSGGGIAQMFGRGSGSSQSKKGSVVSSGTGAGTQSQKSAALVDNERFFTP